MTMDVSFSGAVDGVMFVRSLANVPEIGVLARPANIPNITYRVAI